MRYEPDVCLLMLCCAMSQNLKSAVNDLYSRYITKEGSIVKTVEPSGCMCDKTIRYGVMKLFVFGHCDNRVRRRTGATSFCLGGCLISFE